MAMILDDARCHPERWSIDNDINDFNYANVMNDSMHIIRVWVVKKELGGSERNPVAEAETGCVW